MSGKNRGGDAVIRKGLIIIEVPIDALQTIADGAWFLGGLAPRAKIIDKKAFAKDLVRALNDEDEQGTTMIHSMFDRAIGEAWDNGAEGIEVHPEQDT